jgi:acyl-CoA reductase-like NAD-dependent aldehyde dehydrogenase
VHGVWLPAVALKVPLALKPGGREPWTPWRIAQALGAAGLPPEALSFYPARPEGAVEILKRCDRSLLFGDAATVEPWRGDARVQVHGPGWSKVLVGADQADAWLDHLELLETSVASGGGRSCLNASSIWVARHAAELGEALARRLEAIEPRPLDHPEARLAAMKRQQAEALSGWIDRQLALGGARELTRHPGGRLARIDGLSFLRPTLVACESPAHPLATAELLFPYASVVELPQAAMLEALGPSLVVTAVTADPGFIAELERSPAIDRLNIGRVPTNRIDWSQPHEGNLFAHLYRQRALGLEAAPR